MFRDQLKMSKTGNLCENFQGTHYPKMTTNIMNFVDIILSFKNVKNASNSPTELINFLSPINVHKIGTMYLYKWWFCNYDHVRDSPTIFFILFFYINISGPLEAISYHLKFVSF